MASRPNAPPAVQQRPVQNFDDVSRALRRVNLTLDAHNAFPPLGSGWSMVDFTAVGSGVESVPHELGRAVVGYMVVRAEGSTYVPGFDADASDDRHAAMTFSNSGTFRLIFF